MALVEIIEELKGAGQVTSNWITNPSTVGMLNDLTNSLPDVKQKFKNVLQTIISKSSNLL